VSTDATAITNLLYRYAELMDLGDFAGAARLFDHARIKVMDESGGWVDSQAIQKIWEDGVMRYEDGTPRTKHVTTNAIVEFADDGNTATARSYYTVFQQVGDTPLQPIVAGRYHDRFELVDGAWRWSERDYTLMDLLGDLSRHISMELPS
jgi:3-phenylpropionate/cinnamic acid dioxygenase small subunit